MAPTGQRLGTHDLAGAYIAFRLEEQLDAILAQRRFYAGDDLAFEDERLAHAGVVQSHAVEVAALHRAKRDDRAVAHDADRRSRILDAVHARAHDGVDAVRTFGGDVDEDGIDTLGADAGRAQGERIGRKARERLRPVGREAEGEGATQVP